MPRLCPFYFFGGHAKPSDAGLSNAIIEMKGQVRDTKSPLDCSGELLFFIVLPRGFPPDGGKTQS
jgi:hypothetical protein